MKKALSLILAAGLALVGVPVGAQGYGPNTVWGVAPASASTAVNALLLDATSKSLATVPVVGGRFAFRDVAAGQYTVALQSATGQELARSMLVVIASGAEAEALFSSEVAAAAVVAAGGIGTTAWILMGAAAVGITTAIVVATNNNDNNVASPIR